MDQLKAIKYFVKVVENGSFSKAATLFSVPASSLSRRIADLESNLGATLLKRSTRSVTLTEIGKIYYQQVTEVLALLSLTDETVKNYQSTPMGMLNISSMVGFGEKILLPLLDEFNLLYPEITLNVSLSDDIATLARDEVDIAIRGGYAPDERVIAVKLMENNFIAVASPKYLQENDVDEHGVIYAMQLRQHKGLYFRTPKGPIPWICEINHQLHDVSAKQVMTSNSGKWLVDNAVSGKGILMMPRWVLKSQLDSGELKELTIEPALDISKRKDLGVFMLYQKQRYQVPKIKAMADFLTSRVKGVY